MSGVVCGLAEGVFRVAVCRLNVVDDAWGYATAHATDIDRHWAQRSAENPHMFNGVIHLISEVELKGERLDARFLATDFRSYLYWRENGFPEAAVRDGFGSGLIRSSEGYVVLGRQRAGNVNAGLSYLPGGFIDPRDVTAERMIDIEASIMREVAEETGLAGDNALPQPGFIVTSMGPYISIAMEILVPLVGEEVRRRVLAHIADDPQSELTDAVVVRDVADLDGVAAPTHPYARRLLAWLFQRESAGNR